MADLRPADAPSSPLLRGVLPLGLLGALLQWACLPPLGLAPLGWLAPVPWLYLARLPVLPGRRPYWGLWVAGSTYWVLTNHWLRLPHPATSLGWFTLSFYLGVFAPLLVGLARVAARRGVSLVVAGPVLWIAADQARAYLWTGFSMSSLCHSQWLTPWAVQCADVCGEFGVTLLMVVVSAALARMLPLPQCESTAAGGWSPRWLIVVAVVVGTMYFYGDRRLSKQNEAGPTIRIALIQGSIESEVKHDPDKPPQIYDHYMQLSRQAVETPGVQLVVWPETMYPYPYWQWTDDAAPPPGEEWSRDRIAAAGRSYRELIGSTARSIGKPLLLGIAAAEFGKGNVKGFNSVLHVGADGAIGERYDKQHRVIFGEYIPLADVFPWLYAMTPLTGGIEAGREAKSITVDGVRLAPNVCYETTLGRVLRRQVAELRVRDEEPGLLVNVTNDGWFRGSSELDLHLACGVFRAVELRKPLVIAANTGFSAAIDDCGRVLQQGPRKDAGVVLADVAPRQGPTFYAVYGDWMPWLCLALATATAVWGYVERRQVQTKK